LAHQYDFEFEKFLEPLVKIDAKQTVEYIMQRFGRIKNLNIVSSCVEILGKQEESLFKFLHEVWKKEPKKAEEYADLLVHYYIQFDSQFLLEFLKKSEKYSIPLATRKCELAGLKLAQAYLLAKSGAAEQAIQILCNQHAELSVREMIERAQDFAVNDDRMLQQLVL